jgi:hypothetical protein
VAQFLIKLLELANRHRATMTKSDLRYFNVTASSLLAQLQPLASAGDPIEQEEGESEKTAIEIIVEKLQSYS